jgi:hypothetical protein
MVNGVPIGVSLKLPFYAHLLVQTIGRIGRYNLSNASSLPTGGAGLGR